MTPNPEAQPSALRDVLDCQRCDGEGVIRKSYTYQDSGRWFEDVDELPCPACGGTGKAEGLQ